MTRTLALSVLLLSGATEGFLAPLSAFSSTRTTTTLDAKGFSTKDGSSTPPKKSKTAQVFPPPVIEDKAPFPVVQESDMSQGKAALERMRRERAELRNQELLKVKEVQEVDAMLRESPEAAVIPEKVAQRMGKRMLPFVGLPLFGAMGSFIGFWYFATYRDQEFQPALVAAVSIGLLAVGLVVRVAHIFDLVSSSCCTQNAALTTLFIRSQGNYLFYHERLVGSGPRRKFPRHRRIFKEH